MNKTIEMTGAHSSSRGIMTQKINNMNDYGRGSRDPFVSVS